MAVTSFFRLQDFNSHARVGRDKHYDRIELRVPISTHTPV